MTAAQSSIALKGSRSYVSMFAAVAMGLILVIVVVALSARPLAAPTTLNQSDPADPRPRRGPVHRPHPDLRPRRGSPEPRPGPAPDRAAGPARRRLQPRPVTTAGHRPYARSERPPTSSGVFPCPGSTERP